MLLAACGVLALGAYLAFARHTDDGKAPQRRTGIDVYRGLGAWVDVFDYVPEVGGGGIPVGTADIDAMHAQGVRTVFLQAAFDNDRLPGGVVPEGRLRPLIERAHAHGMAVVGWYAPRFAAGNSDLDRLLAIARFDAGSARFDGIAVDIEDRTVANLARRNARLIALSEALRKELGSDATIGAIVLPTVLLEKVNRDFWPQFPWARIGPLYDVYLPMTYWTDRLRRSGYRDPGRLIDQSVARTRRLTGRADVPVHPIGGIGESLTEDELAAYTSALADVGAIGGSIYDYRTMPTGGWGVLRGRVPDAAD